MIPESEPPNIKATFYGGHWDGTVVYFSGAYPSYTATIPIRDMSGVTTHYERLTYVLDQSSLNAMPLVYRFQGAEKMREI